MTRPTTASFRARCWWANLGHRLQEHVMWWLIDHPPPPGVSPLEHAHENIERERLELEVVR